MKSQGLSSFPSKSKPLKKASKKKLKEWEKYRILRQIYLFEHQLCECGCGRPSEDIHHKKGRGPYYLDVSTFMAVTRFCHDWIHANSKAARERGWLIDTLKHQ